MNRTVSKIFDSHLQLRLKGKVDEDIKKNYSPEVNIITSVKRLRGHDGARESANDLSKDLKNAKFEYVRKEIAGDFAYLVWKAKAKDRRVEHGVDSFLIRDGKIIVQSIFYVVEKSK